MFYSKRIAHLEKRVHNMEEAFAIFMLKEIGKKFGSVEKKSVEKKKAKYGLKKDGSPKGKPGPRKLNLRACNVCGKKFHGPIGIATHTRKAHHD